MRYPFIKEWEGQFSISALCRVMQVARSGYYLSFARNTGLTLSDNTDLAAR